MQDREEVQKLSETDLLEDAVIFGLRMGEGVSIRKLTQRFSPKAVEGLASFFNSLKAEGLATFDDKNLVRLTLKGKLLADKIAVEFMQFAV